jgi:hypothetical protein
MALNGISTLLTKEDRKTAKINLAALKRQHFGSAGYRVLNFYIGSVSPEIGRPWSTFAPVEPGADFIAEDNTAEDIEITTETGDIIEAE